MSDLPVRPSSAALGAGTAAAVLLPKLPTSLVAATAYSTAQAVDGEVIELMSFTNTGLGDDVDRAVRTATGTISWVAAHALVVPLLRRLPLPRPIVAAAASRHPSPFAATSASRTTGTSASTSGAPPPSRPEETGAPAARRTRAPARRLQGCCIAQDCRVRLPSASTVLDTAARRRHRDAEEEPSCRAQPKPGAEVAPPPACRGSTASSRFPGAAACPCARRPGPPAPRR